MKYTAGAKVVNRNLKSQGRPNGTGKGEWKIQWDKKEGGKE